MSELLKGLNIYLIGMMGAGKTTVGKQLAKELDYQFFDTDAVIEQAAGQTVTQLFATSGEASFRTLETQVLAELSAYRRLVIATGGGIVGQRENWGLLRHGVIVWLDLPIDQIWGRLQGDTSRPLLQDADPEAKVRSLFNQRQPLYAQADLRIPCRAGDTPKKIIQRILAQIPTVIQTPTTPPESENN